MKKLISFLLSMIIAVSLQAQDFSTNKVYLKVTNAGATLFGAPDKQSLQIVRISPLISGAEGEVFDYLHDADSTEEAASSIASPALGNYQVKSIFDNSYSFAPPAYKIELNSYGWTDGAYAISQYHVTNIDSFTYQSKFGFEVLPFIENAYGNEKVEYYGEGEYIRIYKDTMSTYVGIKMLSSPLASLYVEDWVSGYNTSDSSLYSNLFYESIIDTFTAADSGSVIFPSINSQTIAPEGTYDVFIALAVGINFDQLDSNMTAVVDKYEDLITNIPVEEHLPQTITLEQNYPNPFNPSTKIKFSLPENEFVEISIFNSIGQLVEKLLSREIAAGNYEIQFTAGNISSGVYFYRLKAGDFISTKKMIVLK